MPSHEAMQDTLEAALTHVGAERATIERQPSATIVPDPSSDSVDQRAKDLLDRLTRRSLSEASPLELHETLGEGGMGVVRLGTQRALGRQVAVKTLKAELAADSASTLKLLREAWVTGRLEHPNVVPVYDIALDAAGCPQIVLKKIEGAEWGTLMHDAAALSRTYGADDPQAWNMQIFMQVCNAVHFAHSRGVLHRDLKPENVMIGAFGEVYVVDWGIAVGLGDDDGDSWLPRARDARELAGTPVYMAPEMLGGPESRLSARTDVYLLGALLYEILTGEAPHRGTRLMEIVSSIIESNPPFPKDAPAELVRIVRRAMDPDPDARFENAEQVRLAVSAFLRHRDGARLAARASDNLGVLRALLDDETALRETIYERFGECRFGVRHALDVWPDNAKARATLEEAVVAMVEYELEQDEPEAARALLGDLPSAPPELERRVDEARAKRAAEDAELRRVSADLDPNTGRLTRAFVTAVVGVIWVVIPAISGVLTANGMFVQTPGNFVVGTSIVFALLIAVGIWARDSMTRTLINRQVGGAAFVGMTCLWCSQLVAHLEGWPAGSGTTAAMLPVAAIMFMLAISVNRWLAVSGVTFLLGFAWIHAMGWSSFVMVVCNLVLLVNMATLWARIDDIAVPVRRRRARRARKR
ncbi:MAG: serine/threonine-protein kinase [Sandaracinaceae bacterium]